MIMLWGLWGLLHVVAVMLAVQFGWITPLRPVFDSATIMLIGMGLGDIGFVWALRSVRKIPVVRVAPPWPGCNDRASKHECIDVAGCPVWVVSE